MEAIQLQAHRDVNRRHPSKQAVGSALDAAKADERSYPANLAKPNSWQIQVFYYNIAKLRKLKKPRQSRRKP